MSETESIGTVLRMARERRGETLEQVSESTKITVHNLTALEEDRFDFFPNRVYARAFLRDYANFLGLDSAALLERYEAERAAGAEVSQVPASRYGPWRVLGLALIACLVIGGLVAVGYIGWWVHGEYKQTTQPAGPTRPARHEQASVSATVKKSPTSKEPAAPEKPPAPQQQPAPELLSLKLTALGNVWVDARTDGQPQLYTTVPRGTVRTFVAKNKIYIRLGRADGAQLELNGKPVELPRKSVPITKVFVKPTSR